MNNIVSRDEAVAALRAAADLIENLPATFGWWFVSAETYNLTGEQLATAARLGGRWEKDATGDMFELKQGIVELHADREQVCAAVETGRTTTVKKVVTPAVTVDVEVPEVEWKCLPLLRHEPVEAQS